LREIGVPEPGGEPAYGGDVAMLGVELWSCWVVKVVVTREVLNHPTSSREK
jgi:hypothetical protein